MAFVLGIYSWIMFRTVRTEIFIEDGYELKPDTNIMFGFWHKQAHLAPELLFKPGIKKTNSAKRSGFLVAREGMGKSYQSTLKRFCGFHDILIGDASPKDRLLALRRSIDYLSKGNLFIAVDGSASINGKEASHGAVLAALHSESPLVLAAAFVKHRIEKPWLLQNQIFPLPFSRIVIAIGKPIHYTGRLSREDVAKETLSMIETLNRLTVTAEKLWHRQF